MDLNLKDKVFLITGGAKGIGRSIALTLVAEGAYPVIVDKDDDAGMIITKEIKELGGNSIFIKTDLTEFDQCMDAVHFAVEHFGRLDGLLNNAGINDNVGLEHGNPELFENSLQKNLMHYYNMAHMSLPYLKKSKGTILNTSSKTAITGQGGTSGYVAAKAGILGLTRDWAVELLPYGIRVNALIPAEVWTPLYEWWVGQFPDPTAKKELIASKIPFEKRFTQPQEIADMAVFLLSSRASHITGQYVFVDGGYTHLDRALT
ncbi:MAG: SDR family oxidoreductase [Saprospiraceae bacterium]